MYLWIIAAVAAYFIKGLCGFANTLVFTSILSFGASNANISPIDLLLGYPTNLILMRKNQRALTQRCIFRWQLWCWQAAFPVRFCSKMWMPEPSSWYSALW